MNHERKQRFNQQVKVKQNNDNISSICNERLFGGVVAGKNSIGLSWLICLVDLLPKSIRMHANHVPEHDQPWQSGVEGTPVIQGTTARP